MRLRDLRAIINLIPEANDDCDVVVLYDGTETVDIERVVVDHSQDIPVVVLDTN